MCIYTYVCVYICVYIYVCVYIYICMYIYIKSHIYNETKTTVVTRPPHCQPSSMMDTIGYTLPKGPAARMGFCCWLDSSYQAGDSQDDSSS